MEKNNDNPEFYKGNEDDDEEESRSNSSSKDRSEEKKRPTETARFFSERKETEARQETAAEKDDNPEEPDLNEEELREAVVAITDEKEVDLRDEIESAPTDSPEQLEAVAHAAFLAGVRARAEREEDFTDETIDEAFEETVEALDLTGNEEHNNSLSDDSEPDIENDTEDADDVLVSTEAEDDDPSAPATVTTTTTSPPVPPLPPSRTSGVSSSSFSGGTPYVSSSPLSSEEMPDVSNDIDRKIAVRRKKRNDLLVGAVVGYIAGRRGGRKRSEKKLLPKIDRLERQVSLLETAIAEREDKIRVLARKTAQQSPQQSFENNEITQVADTKSLTVQERITRFAEKRMEDEKRYDREKVRKRVETTRTHEKIGSLKLSALDVFVEKRLMDGTEKDIKRKPVEIMTESELLEKVGSLSIDGIRVAEAYNNKRLDLESLREITKRYLRSGDYQRVFRYELKASPQELARNIQHIEHLHEKQPHNYLDREEFANRQTYEGNQSNQKDVNEIATQKTRTRQNSVKNYHVPKPIVAAIIFGVVIVLVFLLSQY